MPQYPPRTLTERLYGMNEGFDDDVWLVGQVCRAPTYTISEALAMHREAMHPTVWNIPDAPVRLRLELNMTLPRKVRFLTATSIFLKPKHPLE